MPTNQGNDAIYTAAADLQQAQNDYWNLVARYINLNHPNAGESRRIPLLTLDLVAVREFESSELKRRRAADAFHAILRRRARAMDD
ncbi:MAG: hypothetical protein JW846_10815 [Dehalococcoidia bacterium]|nr:hypothetical protein [Dehalococcoidia bacterium]